MASPTQRQSQASVQPTERGTYSATAPRPGNWRGCPSTNCHAPSKGASERSAVRWGTPPNATNHDLAILSAANTAWGVLRGPCLPRHLQNQLRVRISLACTAVIKQHAPSFRCAGPLVQLATAHNTTARTPYANAGRSNRQLFALCFDQGRPVFLEHSILHRVDTQN